MSFRIFLRLLCFLLLPACAPVDILNATVPQEGYRLQPDIAYGTLSRQKLDLYLPGKVTRDTPVVVFFYGGSWSSGDKAEYLFIGQGLASLGMIAAIPDYRLYPDIRYPEFLRDNALAVTWVYNHIGKYKGNSENLYLMGHSAGAYDAVMLALNRSTWKRLAAGKAGYAASSALPAPMISCR